MKFDVNLSLVFGSLPVLHRARAAAVAGFGAVESWWPFDGPSPPDRELSGFVSSLRDAGVELVALNFDAGDLAAGERGLLSLPGHTARFREAVDAAVELAVQAGGCPVFNALYGNRVEGVTAAEQDETAVANLGYACRQAARIGAKVVLEALNSAENPAYPLTSTAHVLERADAVARATGESPWVLFDCYHLAVMGEDLAATVAAHAGRFGHVQLADAPGRHEPGTGEIDFDALLAALGSAGYDGWIGLEYRPADEQAPAFGWLDRLQTTGRAR